MKFNLHFFKVNSLDEKIIKSVVMENSLSFNTFPQIKDIHDFRENLELNLFNLIVIDKKLIKSDELNYILKFINKFKLIFLDSFIDRDSFGDLNFEKIKKYYTENILIELILIYGDLVKSFRFNSNVNYESATLQNDDVINLIGLKEKSFVAVPSIDKIDLITLREVIYCEADGKYTIFNLVDGGKIVSSTNIGEYEDHLSKEFFFRVHHKYIINMEHLKSINKKDGYYCEMSDKARIPIAKRRQDDFNKFLRLKY